MLQYRLSKNYDRNCIIMRLVNVAIDEIQSYPKDHTQPIKHFTKSSLVDLVLQYGRSIQVTTQEVDRALTTTVQQLLFEEL